MSGALFGPRTKASPAPAATGLVPAEPKKLVPAPLELVSGSGPPGKLVLWLDRSHLLLKSRSAAEEYNFFFRLKSVSPSSLLFSRRLYAYHLVSTKQSQL